MPITISSKEIKDIKNSIVRSKDLQSVNPLVEERIKKC